MIADLDRSIEQLLVEELDIRNGEIDIKFDQPKREWSARLSRPTINFFLYDVRENNILRQHGWEKIQVRNGEDIQRYAAKRKRLPFRMDCNYMVTTWATEPEDEHRLMSRCMLALLRHPKLPDRYLLGDLQEQPFEIQAALARNDKLTKTAEVWGALDNEIRPSLSYMVTLAFDPWDIVTGTAVRTVTTQMGQTNDKPARRNLVQPTVDTRIRIGGTVLRQGKPQVGVQVAIKGTGLFATTDGRGRYVLAAISPGSYTLVIWPQEGNPVQHPIVVPGEIYDVDL